MEPKWIAAELFVPGACVLGEGPSWFAGRLWWIDIEEGLLHSCDERGGNGSRWSLGQRVGAVAPMDRDTVLVALERSLVSLDLASGRQTPLCRVDLPDGHRFNDGKCDPAGRFVVGTLDMNGGHGGDALYVFEKGKPVRLLKDGLSLSNGLSWSGDGRAFYHIDTVDRTVCAYDYDVRAGTLSGERCVLSFPEGDGFPDGMSIDGAGRLWIAFWDGWAVRAYDPIDGTCLAEIPMRCARPTSCCFGGEGLDRLFITTARRGLDEAELMRQPLAGGVFVCDPAANGLPTSIFL